MEKDRNRICREHSEWPDSSSRCRKEQCLLFSWCRITLFSKVSLHMRSHVHAVTTHTVRHHTQALHRSFSHHSSPIFVTRRSTSIPSMKPMSFVSLLLLSSSVKQEPPRALLPVHHVTQEDLQGFASFISNEIAEIKCDATLKECYVRVERLPNFSWLVCGPSKLYDKWLKETNAAPHWFQSEHQAVVTVSQYSTLDIGMYPWRKTLQTAAAFVRIGPR